MAGTPITQFELDAGRLAVIRECMENYDVGAPDVEWPNNIISRHAVVYGSGVIARRDVGVRHAVDPDELALCRDLAAEIAGVMSGVDVGMGSQSGDAFCEFFIASNVNEASPAQIDEHLIRARFGGTIFPPATITVEPLREAGVWWSEVQYDGSESDEEYFIPWRAMMKWFRERADFVDSAFVRIGDGRSLRQIPEEQRPKGTEMTGCVLPRLALGLTRGGSLTGLFGFSVQT